MPRRYFTSVLGAPQFAPKGQPSIARGVNPWYRSPTQQPSPGGAPVMPPPPDDICVRRVWFSAARSIALSGLPVRVMSLFPGAGAPWLLTLRRFAAGSFNRQWVITTQAWPCSAGERRLEQDQLHGPMVHSKQFSPRSSRNRGKLLWWVKHGQNKGQLRGMRFCAFIEPALYQRLPYTATGSYFPQNR